ncbi:MAG TPA: glycosyltransferase [Rhizomicrobium sp.]|jgi:GT2 family glycosyltransferase|nr:glycosyltransferase [Rhizomicrobium sp.]
MAGIFAASAHGESKSAGLLMRRLQEDWRTLGRLMRKARSRLQETPGTHNKLKEAARIARKAREKLSRRLRRGGPQPNIKITHSRQSGVAAQRVVLSTLLLEEVLPACTPLGGGTIAIAVDGAAIPDIQLRDSLSNLYGVTVLDRHSEASGPDGRITTQLLVQAPRELVNHSTASFELLLRTQNEQIVFENIRLETAVAVNIRDFRFENSCVVFSGEWQGGEPAGMFLGLFVDGELSASCTLSPRGETFSATMAVDHTHLDGHAHILELRETVGMSILATLYQILPLHITSWQALQAHARPPLDGALSHQARHHFHSYRLWFDRLRENGPGGVPTLDRLYHEIQQGFRKRHSYPKITFPRHEHPTVSIVIPVHNKFEVTYYCLCSILFAFNETPFEIIVVDDGSTDETAKILEFVDGIQLLRRTSAHGFVQACNDGAALACGELMVLLNNDTEVTTRWLDELVSVFRNFDRVGLAGSKLVYPDGRLQEAGGVIWGSGNPWNVGRHGNADDPKYNYLRKADYVSGACMMIQRSLWNDVGGFSPEFAPAYFEDTDLAMKVRSRGRFVVYVPASTVYHFEGQSAGTNTATGMKAFQELNRPKFRKKWAQAYRNHGREGEALDFEKDRNAAFRVLFIDHQYPFVDLDAGSYATFQEIRLLQSLGAKVTFLPRNLAWMDRHTTALQRIGVECLYAPYVMNFPQYIGEHASNFDLIFVTRYKVAEQAIPIVRAASPKTMIAFNLADLHFLRELREAAARTPGYSRMRAEETRRAELAVVKMSDITFSYSDVELGILRRHISPSTKLAKMPWVVDCSNRTTSFSATRDILFLGGFGHPPNAQAVKFFAGEVMPLIRKKLPDAVFNVIGSGARARVRELSSDFVRILGYVPKITSHLDHARVFVAPLLAGAGLKGKVLDAISHGVPCVLSPIAVEGTGLTHGLDCLIADSKEAWVDWVVRLYTDEELWTQISANALKLATINYSFDGGASALENELARIGISSQKEWGLAYQFTRPMRYGI